MRRLAFAFSVVAAAAVALLVAAPAIAEPNNPGTLHMTLDCPTGDVPVVFQLSSGSAFHVVRSNSNYVWKSLEYVAPTGETVRYERGVNGRGRDLVTCTYTGAVSGYEYVVTGFFSQ